MAAKLLCAAGGLALLAATPCTALEPPDSYVLSETMVPMRDGVKLATDVYRPAIEGKPAPGRFPVLLWRSPYNKRGQRRDGAFFTAHGYVVVAQDCRGRFESEGQLYPLVNDGADGYDTIEWAAVQPWSNGAVATDGASYLGWVQLHAAMERPPHLVAMFVEVAGADFLNETAYPGGVPNLGWPLWILRTAANSPEAARNPSRAAPLNPFVNRPVEWWAIHPQKRAEVLQGFPDQRRAYADFYDHSERDAYWQQPCFHTAGYYREMKDVPMLFLSGWYDPYAEGSLENFAGLSRIQKTPKRVVIGPWPHAAGHAECGDFDFGPDATVDQRSLALDWFDHWIKGTPFQMVSKQPVRIFRMGGGTDTRGPSGGIMHGGRWIEASPWPLPGVQGRSYYLHAEKTISERKPGNEAPSSFVFDPDHPVPTIGGRSSVSAIPVGPQNQVCSSKVLGCADSLPLEMRPDVLSFKTGPLKSSIDVTGPVRARLWISSDVLDTDFTAKLIDVFPDGYAMNLTDGQLRTRYRAGREQVKFLTRGESVEITIELGSTSNLFQPGHRIRVDISSSNYPKFEPNPNTGEPVGRWTRRIKAHNTVYHDASRPSCLELPVISAKAG